MKLTLRGLLGALIISTVALIYFEVNAKGKLKFKVTPPASAAERTDYSDVLSVTMNSDGSLTLLVYVCGTMMEITGTREAHADPDMASLAEFNKIIAKACPSK